MDDKWPWYSEGGVIGYTQRVDYIPEYLNIFTTALGEKASFDPIQYLFPAGEKLDIVQAYLVSDSTEIFGRNWAALR